MVASRAGAALALLTLAAALPLRASACTHWPDGGPNATFTGDDCEIPVTAVDWTDSRSPPAYAAQLPPHGWQCFAMSLPLSWNYLAVQLDREDGESDPDLYGMYYEAARVGDRHPTGNLLGWDFSEISSSTSPTVSIMEARADIPPGTTVDGAWLCVYAYGTKPSNFTVRPVISECPVAFSEADPSKTMVCSTEENSPSPHGSCHMDGVCECYNGFKPPEGVETFPSLGFDSCAASLAFIPAAERDYEATDQRLKSGGWAFYQFDVTADDYEISVSAVREGDEQSGGGRPSLYLKFGAPPADGWRQYDLRASRDWYSQEAEETTVTFNAADPSFKVGTWYAGVHASHNEPATFTMQVAKYECPSGCNGRADASAPNGGCKVLPNATRVCECVAPYFGGDCSGEFIDPAHVGNVWSLSGELRAGHYDYFRMPKIDAFQAKRHVELRMSVTFAVERQYYSWITARPLLLMLRGASEADYPQDEPSKYTIRQALQQEGETFTMNLCPSQLDQGYWTGALYNPVSITTMTYNVTFIKTALCPTNNPDLVCSGHGSCCDESAIGVESHCRDSTFGSCHCEGNFEGADCSVDTDSLRSQCSEGSTRHTQGAGGEECIETCTDGTYGGCDECTSDEHLADAAGKWTCVRRCEGAAGARKLGGCAPGTLLCAAPLRAAAGEGELGCYNPGCAEGTETKSAAVEVANGVCMAECKCGPAPQLAGGAEPEMREEPVCAPDASACSRVACDYGFVLEAAVEGVDAPEEVAAGAKCVPAPKKKASGGGTSGGIVAFLCFLFLGLGAGAGVGGYVYYKRRQAGGPGGGFEMGSYGNFSDM